MEPAREYFPPEGEGPGGALIQSQLLAWLGLLLPFLSRSVVIVEALCQDLDLSQPSPAQVH